MRLASKGITLVIEQEARDWLAKVGYDPQYGARPLRRTIQDKLLTPLASMMIGTGLLEGATVTITLRGDEPHFDVKRRTMRPRSRVRSRQPEELVV
jgi:ATP-dependent Clp protease ATP-binding subunit ClpA